MLVVPCVVQNAVRVGMGLRTYDGCSASRVDRYPLCQGEVGLIGYSLSFTFWSAVFGLFDVCPVSAFVGLIVRPLVSGGCDSSRVGRLS